jgi:hypothetical protein
MTGLDLYYYGGGFATPEQARDAWERVQVVAKAQVPGGAGIWNLHQGEPPTVVVMTEAREGTAAART